MSGSEWFLFPLRVSGLEGLWCGASCVALWDSGYKGYLQQAFFAQTCKDVQLLGTNTSFVALYTYKYC